MTRCQEQGGGGEGVGPQVSCPGAALPSDISHETSDVANCIYIHFANCKGMILVQDNKIYQFILDQKNLLVQSEWQLSSWLQFSALGSSRLSGCSNCTLSHEQHSLSSRTIFQMVVPTLWHKIHRSSQQHDDTSEGILVSVFSKQ